eukprot:m.171778 g.171778  ORF g.171778 m.171778 type:complete len:449 (+) comp13423_c0_seq1:136-1482(+)
MNYQAKAKYEYTDVGGGTSRHEDGPPGPPGLPALPPLSSVTSPGPLPSLSFSPLPTHHEVSPHTLPSLPTHHVDADLHHYPPVTHAPPSHTASNTTTSLPDSMQGFEELSALLGGHDLDQLIEDHIGLDLEPSLLFLEEMQQDPTLFGGNGFGAARGAGQSASGTHGIHGSGGQGGATAHPFPAILETQTDVADVYRQVVPDEKRAPTLEQVEGRLEEIKINNIPPPSAQALATYLETHQNHIDYESLIEYVVPTDALLLQRAAFNTYDSRHGVRKMLKTVHADCNKVLTAVRRKLQARQRARAHRKQKATIQTRKRVRARWRKARLTLPLLGALRAMVAKAKEAGQDAGRDAAQNGDAMASSTSTTGDTAGSTTPATSSGGGGKGLWNRLAQGGGKGIGGGKGGHGGHVHTTHSPASTAAHHRTQGKSPAGKSPGKSPGKRPASGKR